MYSISNVIVGVPLTRSLSRLVEEECDERWAEWEDLGFNTLYHGSSPDCVGFCGVEIGQFDECVDWIRIEIDNGLLMCAGDKRIDLVPTEGQISEARD